MSRLNRHFKWLALCISVYLIQCATPGSPSGGPKDTQPPGVIDDQSSVNPAINFDADEIVIAFDEWVKLENPSTQIIVSPPIDPRPVPKLSRKTVVIPIERDDLRDNTTYIINFGDAIQDITEGNVPPNMTYVFSTGPYVDSLSIRGSLYDAYSGEPLSDVRVLLHTTDSDTAIFRSLPAYFATTDSAGYFNLEYLRADTFWVYAIREEGYGNYKLEDGEAAAFLDSPIVLTDTSSPQFQLALFNTVAPVLLVSINRRDAVQKVILNREPDEISLIGYPAEQYWDVFADTIRFWYTGQDTVTVELLEASQPFDTVRLYPSSGIPQRPSLNLAKRKRHPVEPLNIVSNEPVSSIAAGLVSVWRGDSLEISGWDLVIDSLDKRILVLNGQWEEKAGYSIKLIPGALTTDFATQNDSIELRFAIDESVNFGALNLTVAGLDSTMAYVLEINDADRQLFSFPISGMASETFILSNMEAKQYSASVIEDANRNGRWDTGDIREKRQPERIFTEAVTGMRPGWDLDLTINWPER